MRHFLQFDKLLALTTLLFAVIASTGGIDQISADLSWPEHKQFGQLSSVAVDKNGLIYVFHRGDRQWDANTFRINNQLSDISSGPIKQNTIFFLESNGKVIGSTGKNLFFMPHGLTIDDDLNVWITDVGLHQVMMFPPLSRLNQSLSKPILTLGNALTPGLGKYAFCKPTSVAVEPLLKDFFVGDGYCNSRIVKYNKDGKYLMEWGKRSIAFPFPIGIGPYNLNVPHSLALDSKRNQIIVADRENFRIVFYTLDGKFVQAVPLNYRVYGVSYSYATDTVQGVTGPSDKGPGKGLILNPNNYSISGTFGTFQNAHDVAVSPDGRYVFVVETNPFLFWRFMVGKNASLAAKVQTAQESIEQINVSSGRATGEGDGFKSNAIIGLEANQVALSVVTAAVLLAIVAVTCHLRKQKGQTLPMERRGLILSEER